MGSDPEDGGPLQGEVTTGNNNILQPAGHFERAVRKQAMVTGQELFTTGMKVGLSTTELMEAAAHTEQLTSVVGTSAPLVLMVRLLKLMKQFSAL